MISGGHHANIFNLSLGTAQLDNSITKIVDRIQSLERDHSRLRQVLDDEIQTKESQVMR